MTDMPDQDLTDELLAAAAALDAAAERMFELDLLSDNLTSGRLGGTPIDPVTVELMLALLERLEWVPRSRQLAGALPHFPEGFGLAEMRSTFANLGFPSREAFVHGGQLNTCPPGTLVCDARGELWLIRGSGRKPQLVQPGEDKQRTQKVRRGALYRCFHFDRAAAEQSGGLATLAGGSWSGELLHRFAPEIRLMVVLTLISGATAILIAFGLTKIFDTVIPTRNTDTLKGIILGLLLVFGLDFTTRQIRASVVGRISGRMEYALGGALFGKLLNLPSQRFDGVPLSDQMARLRQFETIRDLFGGPVTLLLLDYPLVILMLTAVAIMAWQLALLLAALIVAFVTLGAVIAPAVRRAGKLQGAAQNRLNRTLLEVLTNREQIRREGLGSYWVGAVENHTRELLQTRRRHQAITRVLDGLAYASLPLSAATVIGSGAILVMNGSVTAGQLVASTILTWRLFAPVQQTLKLLPKLQDVRGLFTQIDALMRLPDEEKGAADHLGLSRMGQIETRGVVLRHPGSIAPTLVNIQFEIPHGTLVAVTGRSGAGKTTLLRILAGQLAPQAGAVLLNALNVAQLSRDFRARRISYVGPSPLFIFGTIAQNLRFSDPAASDKRLQNVLEQVGLGGWVASLPDGIDTRIDSSIDGSLMTSSVRYCIAVAQALLTDPAVLLLDEPAGTIDPEHEAQLYNTLEAKRGEMTCVIVTHRPSLMRRTDSVIFLNGGNAVMRATKDLERAAS